MLNFTLGNILHHYGMPVLLSGDWGTHWFMQ